MKPFDHIQKIPRLGCSTSQWPLWLVREKAQLPGMGGVRNGRQTWRNGVVHRGNRGKQAFCLTWQAICLLHSLVGEQKNTLQLQISTFNTCSCFLGLVPEQTSWFIYSHWFSYFLSLVLPSQLLYVFTLRLWWSGEFNRRETYQGPDIWSSGKEARMTGPAEGHLF